MDKPIKILAAIILFILCVPAFVHLVGFKVINPLKGAYQTAQKPEFSIKQWETTQYQENTEKYVEDHLGFRPQIVRLTNQINYSLFGELNPKGLIIGKENYLFEIPYLLTKAGHDFIGADSIKQIVNQLQQLNDTLFSKNIHLLFLLAPDKATFYDEYISPKKKKRFKPDSTNYQVFSKLLQQSNIPHINYNPLFLLWKDTASYPLFPQYGTHWSIYGNVMATDTLLKKMEAMADTTFNSYSISEIIATTEPKFTDYDIGQSLNLIKKLPGTELAYPVISANSLKYKPNVLSIGDSYYITFLQAGIVNKLFNKHDFLFYNKRVFNNDSLQINLPNDYKNYNFVIIEATTPNIKLLNYGL